MDSVQSILSLIRYVVFALLVVSNIVLSAAAIWNYLMSQSIGFTQHVDIYIACVGMLLAAWIVLLSVCSRLRLKNWVYGRVWFECTWFSLFLAMEFAGAIAATVVLPSAMCFKSKSTFSIIDSCSSAHLLLAFIWLSTALLFSYALLLSTSAFLLSRTDSQIWHCEMRNFPWLRTQRHLPSAPTSPSFPHVPKESVAATTFAAPMPRRAHPSQLYSYRAGLGSEYEIEHFKPVPISTVPTIPLPLQQPQTTRPELVHPSPPTSLYPAYLQAVLATQHPSTSQRGRVLSSPPSPPPLGSWPNRDPVALPSKRTRNLSHPILQQAEVSSSGSRSRPGGPRTKRRDGSLGSSRPPPLNLSNISTHTETN